MAAKPKLCIFSGDHYLVVCICIYSKSCINLRFQSKWTVHSYIQAVFDQEILNQHNTQQPPLLLLTILSSYVSNSTHLIVQKEYRKIAGSTFPECTLCVFQIYVYVPLKKILCLSYYKSVLSPKILTDFKQISRWNSVTNSAI